MVQALEAPAFLDRDPTMDVVGAPEEPERHQKTSPD
jgi:hypothetical protein